MPSYQPKIIEPKWQRFWLEHKTFRTPDESSKPKFYILDMFPYPSGDGLHVGHPEGYTATDILARYKRMKGFNVLHPMGWDAFGLPAEEYARKTGEHPRTQTRKNIDRFRQQIQMLGFSYDWDREVDTTDPNYYRWTQWIFLVLFDTWYDREQRRGRPIAELPIPPEIAARGEKAIAAYRDSKRLAYQSEAPVNWCPELGTVLANEEVKDGKSERGGHPVMQMPLRQWLLRITEYADRLLDDLDRVDWPEPIKKMQREWIGRSEGAEVEFRIAPTPTHRGKQSPAASLGPGAESIRVFTTRPDTLFGATYMVLAPEHPLVEHIATPQQRQAVLAYRTAALSKSERDRKEAKKKTGVDTGAKAINPVNGEKIPIWVADYVLWGYGTGAIMAVPAHDERDFEFAREFDLPIRTVVQPPAEWIRSTTFYQHLEVMEAPAGDALPTIPRIAGKLLQEMVTLKRQYKGNLLKVAEQIYLTHPDAFDEVFVGDGTAVHSGPFDGLATAQFKQKITAWLEERGQGNARVNFKLRDWLFSRQRYWGEPFPILHQLDEQDQPTGIVEPLDADELPLLLPELADYKPTGKPEPPLEKATDWVHVVRNGKKYRRETNTMPQWAGSCWYYLRYIDPHNERMLLDPARDKRFMPVDLYVGGAEHAVLHLLYARFWHKVLFDRGIVTTPEPFQRLINQGMILGEPQYHVTPETYKKYQRLLDERKIIGVLVDDEEKPLYVLLNQSETGERSSLGDRQVEKTAGKVMLAGTPVELIVRADKMSKSRGNVVNPNEIVDRYGADTLRLYEMYMGPLEAVKPWSTQGMEGPHRFLNRVWRLIVDDRSEAAVLADTVQHIDPDPQTLRMLHRTIKKVTEDLETLPVPRFNTALAAMMEFTNHLTGLPIRPRKVLEKLVLILSPFAPHVAEELWQILGHRETLAFEPWPDWDEALTREEQIEVPVQINGKVRARLTVPATIDESQLKAAVLADEKVQGLIGGKEIKNLIVAKGNKLVSIAIK